MLLSKVPGESDFEYHKRLIYGKLVDRTLSDVDYSELAEQIYGIPYSSDVARRMMYGSRKTLELLENNRTDLGSLDIDEKTRELKRERQRLSDQRREYNKIVNAEGRYDNLKDALIKAANALDSTVGSLYQEESFYEKDLDDNKAALLVFSDWHYGMVTNNVFNEFNTSICKERVKKVVEEAISRIALHRCKSLHIFVLGDLVHGAIHTSARVASEELVCDQLMQVSEILAQSIYKLSLAVDNVIVYTTYGNHARTIPNKNDNIHRDNFERLIPWWLSQRLDKFKNIFVAPESPNELIVANILGHTICASHGDLDSVKTSPRLLGTLLRKKYGVEVEYIVLGDKHHRESFDELGITAEICSSLCGTDDYANEKRMFSSPSQLMLIIDENDGVDAEYRIRCS